MRNIIQVPNPILHQVSKPVENIDAHIKDLADEMVAILTSTGHLGLAAIQLGESVRMIVVVRNIRSRELSVIINPEIVKRSSQMTNSREGCLSIGKGLTFFTVKRHKLIRVTGLNIYGNKVVYRERGKLGFVLQHEIDHLDGKLIADK